MGSRLWVRNAGAKQADHFRRQSCQIIRQSHVRSLAYPGTRKAGIMVQIRARYRRNMRYQVGVFPMTAKIAEEPTLTTKKTVATQSTSLRVWLAALATPVNHSTLIKCLAQHLESRRASSPPISKCGRTSFHLTNAICTVAMGIVAPPNST